MIVHQGKVIVWGFIILCCLLYLTARLPGWLELGAYGPGGYLHRPSVENVTE